MRIFTSFRYTTLESSMAAGVTDLLYSLQNVVSLSVLFLAAWWVEDFRSLFSFAFSWRHITWIIYMLACHLYIFGELLKSLTRIFTGIFKICFKSSFYVLDYNPLSGVLFTSTFSQSMACLLIFLKYSVLCSA